jgi:hypothetical protein
MSSIRLRPLSFPRRTFDPAQIKKEREEISKSDSPHTNKKKNNETTKKGGGLKKGASKKKRAR